MSQFRSTFGANNITYVPQVFEADGGGGGGSSFGGGCDPGTFSTIPGNLTSPQLISPHLTLSYFTMPTTASLLTANLHSLFSFFDSLISFIAWYQSIIHECFNIATTTSIIPYRTWFLIARTLYWPILKPNFIFICCRRHRDYDQPISVWWFSTGDSYNTYFSYCTNVTYYLP